MIEAVAFAAFLAGAVVLANRSGSPALRRTGWAMALNMALVWAAQAGTHSYAPWEWFVLIDFATAMIVLANPAGRPQAYIGAIYVAQIIVHVAFGLGGAAADGARQYLDMLAFGGGCQILILATGAIHAGGRKVGRAGLDGGSGADPAQAHLARMEARQ